VCVGAIWVTGFPRGYSRLLPPGEGVVAEMGFLLELELGRGWVLQGLKPGIVIKGLIGPAEAVPLLQSLLGWPS